MGSAHVPTTYSMIVVDDIYREGLGKSPYL